MRLGKAILVFIIVSLIIIAGCYYCGQKQDDDDGDNHGKNGDDANNQSLKFTVENYPRVDGSTSAHPLAAIVACNSLNISYTWTTYWDNTKRIVPNASEPGKEYIAENITEKVIHHGTHTAYTNLIQNYTDIILVAREPSEDELGLAGELGVELEIKPVALDAFVFILNINNVVESLTVKQIQDIYTGNITRWDTVGGSAENITPYMRNDNSGSQELMEALVMKDLEMIDAPELILLGMMGPINMLSSDETGIGYSVYFFEEFMAPNELIKLCGVDGIIPNYETIKSKQYTFTTEVHVVIRSDLGKNTTAYQLMDWLLSEEGQQVVKESGYVPIK